MSFFSVRVVMDDELLISKTRSARIGRRKGREILANNAARLRIAEVDCEIAVGPTFSEPGPIFFLFFSFLSLVTFDHAHHIIIIITRDLIFLLFVNI